MRALKPEPYPLNKKKYPVTFKLPEGPVIVVDSASEGKHKIWIKFSNFQKIDKSINFSASDDDNPFDEEDDLAKSITKASPLIDEENYEEGEDDAQAKVR